jgi:regulator of sirC expression with transglutaminase-like and TPR domain
LRKRIFARARKRKSKFSDEIRKALEFYVDLPPDFDEQALAALVKEANASMDRSIAKLDETLSFLAKFRGTRQ